MLKFSIQTKTSKSMGNLNQKTHRREFIGSLATGAATLGMAAIAAPIRLHANAGKEIYSEGDPNTMFDKIKAKKHRVVFDATQPHEVMPFAWPLVYLMTNEATGSPNTDCGVVVILRHEAIPYAMEDSLWAKYKFGEVFKAGDPVNKTEAAVRNPFWNPKPGDFVVPGLGDAPIGINQLQEKGVMFCACDVALTVYSAAIAAGANLDAAELKKEWLAGLLPNIQVVPSGVWAAGRAQESGCAYIFAG
jgi:intracellular sulfur oxidation DsrE/DsrF family protein